MEVIDVSTFDKQKEKQQRTEKIQKKIAEKEINTEIDKKYKSGHVQNPFIHQKTPKSNEELEKSKLISASIKNETLYEKYKKEKAKAELAKIQSQRDIVEETINLESAIQEFSNTDVGAVATQNLNNLISSYYSNNIIKKQIFKERLVNNPVIQRNNQLLVYNVLTSLPLSLQLPLFVGLEILQTEDIYNQIVFNEEVKKQQKSTVTELKEEEPKN